MSFLKAKNIQHRLFLQLKGFQSNTYLNIVGDLLDVPVFRLPKILFSEKSISRLVMPERLRLGNRLEHFFSFVIQESHNYEIIAENIQIFENKITLGELDFLILDKKKNAVIHVELAGKLYLYDPKLDGELERWIGPNRKDSLLKKTATLKNKQFPLLYTQQSENILNNFGIKHSTIRQSVSYKARLFLPYKLKEKVPDFVSIENIKGYYVNIDDFLGDRFKEFNYFIPAKQDWIVDPKYGEIWFSYKEILITVEDALEEKISPLIWIKKPDNTFETIFVVWW
jgi:hypothetical protein